MKIVFGLNRSASSSRFASLAARPSRAIGDALGLGCLLASLILMSTGVRSVKAEDDARMSVDPQRVAAELRKEAAEISPEKAEVPHEPRQGMQAARAKAESGVPGVEVQPGVVVLNTRGYNYGPPPAAIDPAAMQVEKDLQPAP